MTMAQLCALIAAENARNDAPATAEQGTTADLMALASLAGR